MFKDERVPFLVWKNRVIIGNEGQPDASAWAERLGFPRETYDTSIRGWMTNGRIQLLWGSEYKAVPVLNDWMLCQLLTEHSRRYGSHRPKIYNGVVPGRVNEFWDGLEEVAPTVSHIV